jgi:hypothetical protein
MDSIVIEDQDTRAVLMLNNGHSDTTVTALVQGWQDVMEVAEPQYPEKPLIVEDAIQRETYGPLVGHFLHPDDPSGRTALCGVKIYGIPTFGEFQVCTDCRTLRMAGDAAPL